MGIDYADCCGVRDSEVRGARCGLRRSEWERGRVGDGATERGGEVVVERRAIGRRSEWERGRCEGAIGRGGDGVMGRGGDGEKGD